MLKKHKCYWCGGEANYIVSGRKKKPCCKDRARSCPGYGEFISKKMKKYYKDNPDYLEWQRNNIKEFSHRPKVVKKKSDAMKQLHAENETFIENYSKGRIPVMQRIKELSKKGEHWAGKGTSYENLHLVANKLHKKDSCEKCGMTKEEHLRIKKMNLHMHCKTKVYNDMSKENWICVCISCHSGLEREYRCDH